MSENILSSIDENPRNLRADCGNCFGLCCAALYFSASEGFPCDKEAGQACPNLQSDFRCRVHKSLVKQGFKGCAAFDCFGAGQKVSRVSYHGQDWRKFPESAQQMFKAFLVMRQLHELLWYLTEALTIQLACSIHSEINYLLDKTEQLTHLSTESLIRLDVAGHRANVNPLLLKASEFVRTGVSSQEKAFTGRRKIFTPGADLIAADLRRMNMKGANLRGACLIAADLRGCDLSGTDFIGADLRDTDLRGADLSKSIFLTQAQVNAAKGDSYTKLPTSLTHPKYWAKIY